MTVVAALIKTSNRDSRTGMYQQQLFSAATRKESADSQLQIKFFLKLEEFFTARTQRSRRKANDFDALKLQMKGFLGALRIWFVLVKYFFIEALLLRDSNL